ncbi:DUF4350 domain-containing protein [Roseateles sp. BYS78W]|uniref:DUF4350 domain-containing protein n=1 Tax=Pelomonas candidula TaxID=3299025 RepID=A0ABW7HFP2_9BURK
MNIERLGWLLAALLAVVGGWWLSVNTEWVETDRFRGAQGEARDNPVYAFEQLLRRLGMAVEHHEALDTMPPPGARLVLLSNDWELVRERAGQLHQWVQGGGHLVLTQVSDWEDTALADWVPVDEIKLKRPARAVATPAAPAASAVRGRRPGRAAGDLGTGLASAPPLWEGVEKLAVCRLFAEYRSLQVHKGQQADWTLKLTEAPGTTQALRVSVGQGSVTVLNLPWQVFDNRNALECDAPLMLAAAMQSMPGATTWVYLHEKRASFLPWLWQQGWVAIVAGLLALAAALWRGAVRFGPRLAPAPRLRRSISEQVRGLGAYLLGHGREALLVAQQRALAEVAARKLQRWSRLPVAEQAAAVAAATDLPVHDLLAALSARFCTRVQLLRYLQVLESARRRLHGTPEERQVP